jgi:hypothetical protein
MATWGEFAAAAPQLAATGRSLMYRTGTGEGILATVRDGDLPRLNPIYVAVIGDGLVAFIGKSAKRTDLQVDGRYAFHAHHDPAAPHEFVVRGRAHEIQDPERKAALAAAWYFATGDEYLPFEFLIDHALLGERPTADDWPPVYTSWSAN